MPSEVAPLNGLITDLIYASMFDTVHDEVLSDSDDFEFVSGPSENLEINPQQTAEEILKKLGSVINLVYLKIVSGKAQ